MPWRARANDIPVTGPDVELRAVTREFAARGSGDAHAAPLVAVHEVSLRIGPSEFFSLLGPSGCGKTTTLRMIAGFLEPTRGEILIRGEDVRHVPPYKRNVNTTFQSYALFPHLDVFENIAFGLRRKGFKNAAIREKVAWALSLVRLEGFEKRRTRDMSGGEQQRVAMARALVNMPAVLLLDEPLSALDERLRKQMQLELKRIQREVGITFVLVTHDQEEALTLSDTIAVMHAGRVEQVGTPRDLYENPKTRFVADFIGATNFLSGSIRSREEAWAVVDVAGGSIRVPWREDFAVQAPVELSVRPEKMWLEPAPLPANGRVLNALPARLVDAVYQGAVTRYRLTCGDVTLQVSRQNSDPAEHLDRATRDETLYVHWDAATTRIVQASPRIG